MLDTITDLPRVIDRFIETTIRSIYRIFWGTLLLVTNPLKGAMRLYVHDRSFSSKTMLFCSSVLVAVLLWQEYNDIRDIGPSTNVFRLAIKCIIVYALFDLTSRLVAIISGARGRRRKRASALMRYSFASMLLVMSISTMVYTFAHNRQTAIATDRNTLWLLWLISLGSAILAISVLIQPIVVSYALVASKHKRAVSRLIRFGAVLLVIVTGSMFFTMASSSVTKIEDQIDGRVKIHITDGYCSTDGKTLLYVSGISNDTRKPIIINPASFQIHLSTTRNKDAVIDESPDPRVFYMSPMKMDGGGLKVDAKSVAVITGQIALSNFLTAVIEQPEKEIWCRIEADRFKLAYDSDWYAVVREKEKAAAAIEAGAQGS